jgi:hypothetical protein
MLLLLPSQEPNHFGLTLQLHSLHIIRSFCLLILELKFKIPLLGLNLLLFFLPFFLGLDMQPMAFHTFGAEVDKILAQKSARTYDK